MKALFQILMRRKRQLLAVLIGLLVGAVAWLHVPPEPRVTLPVAYDSFVFSPDGKSYVTAHQIGKTNPPDIFVLPENWLSQILIWDAASNREKIAIQLPGMHVRSIVYSPDSGRVAAVLESNDETIVSLVRIWEIATGNEEMTVSSVDWPELRGRQFAVFFSKDGSLLHFQCDGHLMKYETWDVSGKTKVATGILPPWCVHLEPRKKLPPDGNLETIKMTEEIHCNWDAVLPHCYPARWPGGSATWVPPLDVSADGRTLCRLVQNPGGLEVLDLASGNCKLTFSQGGIGYLSRDGNLVAVKCPGMPEETFWHKARKFLGISDSIRPSRWYVCLLDTTTGRPLADFQSASWARFSPDDLTLALSYDDKTEIWDLPLRTPWGKIAAYALAGFVTVFVLPLLARRLLRRFRKKQSLSAPFTELPA